MSTPISRFYQQYITIANSTATPLDSGQSFVGAWEDVTLSQSVIAAVATDQDGVLYIDFSVDRINADSTLSYVYRAGEINPPHRLMVTRKYRRIRFTNNSGANQHI